MPLRAASKFHPPGSEFGTQGSESNKAIAIQPWYSARLFGSALFYI